MRRFIVHGYAVAVIAIFLAATSLLTTDARTIKPKVVPPKVSGLTKLPVVGSQKNLEALLEKARQNNPYLQRGLFDRAVSEAKGPVTGAAPPAAKSKAADTDYSATNTQVQGVDEADIVKTDGKYLYQVNNQRVVILQANPAEKMKIISTINFADKNFAPFELYVDTKHLVVIGNTYYRVPLPQQKSPADTSGSKTSIYPPYPPERIQNTVKVIIYDISDKSKIKKIREAELEGQYVSSRKISSALYFVTNKYINYYPMGAQPEPLTPAYRDTAGKGKFVSLGYQDIRYFPDCIEPNYLLVAGLDLEQPDREMKVAAYLGSGQNIYASQNNLYVAVTRYAPASEVKPAPGGIIIGGPPVMADAATVIYKFALKQGLTVYLGKGEVPGTVLNQFSMDEHKDYLRIATTKGDIWRNDEQTAKNNVYVLDKALKITGRVENIAPGEKIYSVRFMGDRGYMVTFKKVDPLFVLDLKNPQAPKILGALKIPGYSDYLHPYDENHIIGFGKDAVEEPQKDWQGRETGTMAFYQGMKIALFDVSDVAHPVEKFKETIGDRGTDSELLRNHKALLFNRDKNLLAFPVTVMEIKDKSGNIDAAHQYGEFTFQGAYVYNLDLIKGFSLKGKITHLTSEDLLKSGNGWYQGTKNVERVLYIGNTLYTLSKSKVMAHDLNTLKELGSLEIGQ